MPLKLPSQPKKEIKQPKPTPFKLRFGAGRARAGAGQGKGQGQASLHHEHQLPHDCSCLRVGQTLRRASCPVVLLQLSEAV